MYDFGWSTATLQLPKYFCACVAADIVERGIASPHVAAALLRVSRSSVNRALRLDLEQRTAVRRGKRPLVLPRLKLAPATPVPTPGNPEQRLAGVVADIGLEATLDSLSARHPGLRFLYLPPTQQAAA
jgi:hypothetical protein